MRGYIAACVIALGIGVLVKFTPVRMAFPVLAYLMRSGKSWWKGILTGLVVFAVLAVVLYLPIWAGTDTFLGLREGSGGIPAILRPFFTDFSKAQPEALSGLRLAMTALFLAGYLWMSRDLKRPVDALRV